MNPKKMFLCSNCIELIKETQNLHQFDGRPGEKKKCDWCGKERIGYHCVVGGTGDEYRDHSYTPDKIP